jgi:SRSO17 transposase
VGDPERLTTARVPAADRQFKPKWQIALELLDTVREEGLPHAVVVADAGYGVVGPSRAGLESRQERYIVGLSGPRAGPGGGCDLAACLGSERSRPRPARRAAPSPR